MISAPTLNFYIGDGHLNSVQIDRRENRTVLKENKPFLAQTFPCSHGRSSFLFSCVRRMGRNRKWVLEDNLQEAVWRTILRGPRPPSVSWPQKGKRSSSAAAPSKAHAPVSSVAKKVQAPTAPKSKISSIQAAITALGPDPDPVILSSLRDALQRAKESSKPSPNLHAGKSPDARVAEAQARVSRLQAAVDLLGVDNPDAELLKASLEAAKRQCRVQPVGERLDSCLKFVERAQGRVERQKRIVEEAQQVLANYESQLAAGLQDLERLRAEARACPIPPPTHNEPASETTELRELRLEVEQLKRERNQWMGKTNNSQAMEVVGDSRSSRMASLINEADAKRRCVEPVS